MNIPTDDVTYLDNAATSLTPQAVIDAMNAYYTEYNANVHRGIHHLSETATTRYHEARHHVADFINATPEEIIFTKGTTDALNLVADILTRDLDDNANIVVTGMEHHSNLVPWQQLAQRRDFTLRYITVTNGTLDNYDVIDDNTAVVTAVHVSNFLGTINPIHELIEAAHTHNALTVIDAAQSVPHMPINVQELDTDFLAFSGHKMLGPTGTGVLYGKHDLLNSLPPYQYGGDMIREVTYEDSTWNDLPMKYEAGTPNIAGAIGLGEAARILNDHDMHDVHDHGQRLAQQTISMLNAIEADVYGPDQRGSLVSFNIDDIHPHDVSTVLDDHDIAIRAGHHCVMPLHKQLGITASCRASYYLYNDEDDIEALRDGLLHAREVFS
jgi:cysteine desulfurase/selenocysteine lyase